MFEAAFWGFVGGVALLVGAVLGLALASAAPRWSGLVMAFGSGVLISAVAFDLVEEGYLSAGVTAGAWSGWWPGALTFYGGDWILDHRGGGDREALGRPAGGAVPRPRSCSGRCSTASRSRPRSASTLLGGGGVGVAVVVGGVPVQRARSRCPRPSGLRKAGHSSRWIIGLWLAVAVDLRRWRPRRDTACSAAPRLPTIAVVQAFAAGAILTMLADTMMPEGFANAGSSVGLVTCAGFICAFLLSHAV